MKNEEITTLKNGKYTNDITLVGTNNVSNIIRIVLQDVAKMDVGGLPKPMLSVTFSKLHAGTIEMVSHGGQPISSIFGG